MRLAPVLALLTVSACGPGEGDPVDAPEDTGTGGGSGEVEEWAQLDAQTAAALQAQLDAGVADLGITGAAMALADTPRGALWAGASGMADVDAGEAWAPDRHFHIGSVTKTFTAAAVFQLAEEGALGLDDPLEDWVPGYWEGEGLTLRHLLGNTSGIASYNWIGGFDDSRPWTPTELLEWTLAVEPELRFEPGTSWEYSNTNWVLLGLVIEAATGQTYEAVLTERFFEPLDLEHTYLAASGNSDPELVRCYDADGAELTGTMDPSMGWAAGAIVSTPEDLVRWGAALYAGGVLSAESRAAMTTQAVLPDGTVVEYGLGAFVETDGVDSLTGHTGGYEGYLSYLYHWEADGLTLVVLSNQLETDLRTLAAYGWSVPLGFDFP